MSELLPIFRLVFSSCFFLHVVSPRVVPCVCLIAFSFFLFFLLSLSFSLHQLFDHPCIHIAVMMFLSLKALRSGSGIDPGPTRLPLTIYRSQTPDRDTPDSSKEKWKNRITPPERILGREIRARRESMFTSVKQLLEWSHFSFHVPLKHLTDVERRW